MPGLCPNPGIFPILIVKMDILFWSIFVDLIQVNTMVMVKICSNMELKEFVLTDFRKSSG